MASRPQMQDRWPPLTQLAMVALLPMGLLTVMGTETFDVLEVFGRGSLIVVLFLFAKEANTGAFGLKGANARFIIEKLVPFLVPLLVVNLFSISYSLVPNLGVYVFIELLFVLIWFFSATMRRWDADMVYCVGLACALIASVTGAFLYFVSITGRSNTLIGLSGAFMFFPLLYVLTGPTGYKRFLMFLVAVGIIACALVGKQRTIQMATVAAGMTFLLWPIISARWWTALFYLVSLYVGLALFDAVYANIYNLIDIDTRVLDLIIEDYTGKRLFSGRDALWPLIYEAVTKAPLLGYGIGTSTIVVTDSTLSAHNWFLLQAFQTGGLGLVCFLGFLGRIWMLLLRIRWSPVARLGAGWFVFMTVHQNFEVDLTQNSLFTGLVYWMVLACILSHERAPLLGRAGGPQPQMQPQHHRPPPMAGRPRQRPGLMPRPMGAHPARG